MNQKLTPSQQAVLDNLRESPKTRSQVVDSLKRYSSSAVGDAITKLQKYGLVKFEVIDTRRYRRSGSEYFVMEPNPKIRVYSVIQKEGERKHPTESSKNS